MLKTLIKAAFITGFLSIGLQAQSVLKYNPFTGKLDYVGTSSGGGVSAATLQAGTSLKCTSATGDAAYTCALTPTLTAYTSGMCLVLIADFASVTTATVDVDTLGAKSILGPFGSALAAGDIPADTPVQICYDGLQFIKQGFSYLVQDATDTQLILQEASAQSLNLLTLRKFDNSDLVQIGSGCVGLSSNAIFSGSEGSLLLTTSCGGGRNAISSNTADGESRSPFEFQASNTLISNVLTVDQGGNVTIFQPDATTGATFVDIVAGDAQTTKSVVLQTGGRIIAPLTTPTTSSEPCTAGTITWNTDYIFVCTATDTWKRTALSAF